MPEWADILNEEYESNVRRIAALCARRQALSETFDRLFAKCRRLEQMCSLQLSYKLQTEAIDREVVVLERGSRKLLDQMRVAS